MRRPTALAVLLLLISTGCRRDARRADVASEPGDLLIHVVTDSGGQITAIEAALGDAAAALAFDEGHALHTFVIPAADLVDPSGALLDDDTKRRVRADRGATFGQCGRCLMPGAVGPKVVYPGESCVVPDFARAVRFVGEGDGVVMLANPDETEAVRREIYLTWDGDCPCDRVTPTFSGPAVVCPVAPVGAAIRADVVALFEDGRVFGVNKGFAFEVSVDGAVVETSFLPATGSVQAIGQLADGTTLVGTTDRTLLTRSVLLAEYDRALVRSELEDAPSLEPDQIARLDGNDAIYLIGEQFNTLVEEPGIARCTIANGRVGCTPERVVYGDPRCRDAATRKLVGAFLLPGGAHAALSEHGHVFYRPAGTNEWFCDPDSDRIGLDTSFGRRTITSVLGHAVVGDVAILCVTAESPADDVTTSALLRYQLPTITGTDDPGAAGLAVEVITDDLFGGFCRDVVRGHDGGFRVFEQAGFGAIDLDADGVIERRYQGVGGGSAELWSELPERIVGAKTSSSGHTVAISADRRLYRKLRGDSFLPIVADQPPYRFPAAALLEDDGAVWVFLGDGRSPFVVTTDDGAGCAGVRSETIAFNDALTVQDEFVQLALRDPRFDDRAVLVSRLGGDIWRIDVDLALRSVVRRTMMGPFESNYREGAAVTNGRFVLVRYDGVLQEMTDGALRTLTPVRDDPSTPVVETDVPLVEGRRRFSSISTSHGVAWVGGFGTLARVAMSPTKSTVESFWMDRMFAGAFTMEMRSRPPDFTAVHANCPDDTILMASERLYLNELTRARTRVRGWTIGEGLDALDVYDGFAFAQSEAPRGSAEPIAIAADGGQTTLVFADGVIYRNGAIRSVAPFEDVAAAARGDGFTLVAGGAGRVAAVVDTP